MDLVVHGGDVLYRGWVKPALVQLALEPLLEVADTGVPVVVVPGNHERSAIPYPLLVAHPHLHLLDRPRTLRFTLRRTHFERLPTRPLVTLELDVTGLDRASMTLSLARPKTGAQ